MKKSWAGKLIIKTGAALLLLGSVTQAQESLGGTMAAASISSSMSGMSNSAAITAGSNMRRSTAGFQAGARSDLTESPELFGGGSGSGGMGANGEGAGPGGVAPAPIHREPRRYGATNGSSLLNELLAGRKTMPPIPSPVGGRRSSSSQATLSRRLKNMTDAQRKKLVMQKYDIRPHNWLVHYLKEDRYKISSGMWSFLTTRTSRYYYRPWSAAMLKADPNHVIGFRNWHEALLAGYRPDPVSRPEPGPQIADIAAYTKGPALQRYVEFVYAGQIPPALFNRNYQYIKQVGELVKSYKHTRPYLGETIEKVLLAELGEGPRPTLVGPGADLYLRAQQAQQGANGMGSSGSGSSSMDSGSSSGSSSSDMRGLQAGNTDSRTDQFNTFSNRAGSLANVPANQGSRSSSGPPIN